MTDLHAAIGAALDREQAQAEAASPGPWRMSPDSTYLVGFAQGPSPRDKSGFSSEPLMKVVPGYGTPVYPWDAVHIAAQDPARTLRRVWADRRVLARHSPPLGACDWCALWPETCPELLDLADRYGVETGR